RRPSRRSHLGRVDARLGVGIPRRDPGRVMSFMPATQDVMVQAREALRVLSIEDNPGDAILVREMLHDASPDGFHLENADRLSTAVASLLGGAVDCVLLDLSLPDAEGLEALAQVRTVALDVPIIVPT